MDNDKLHKEFEAWFLSQSGADKKALSKKYNRYVSDTVTGLLMDYVAGYRSKTKLNEEKR